MTSATMALSDVATIAKRNLIKIKRVPDLLVFSTMFPIMVVLLFGYVFGSAIRLPGIPYREYLLVGIFLQTVMFGSVNTGVLLATDLQKGIVDRLRSLPIAKSSVLLARTTSDLLNNLLIIVLMSLTGWLVGWRSTARCWRHWAGSRCCWRSPTRVPGPWPWWACPSGVRR